MPRRKQLHPLHLDSLDQLASLLEYADTCEGYCTRSPSSRPPSESNGEDCTTGDEHICGKCRLEFIDLSDFLHHKRVCTRKRIVLVVGDDSSDDLAAEGRSTSSLDFTDDPDKYGLSVPYLGPASYDKPDSPDSADLPPLLAGRTSQEMVGATEDRPLELEGYSKMESSAMSTESFGSGTNKRGTLESSTVSHPSTLPQYILTQSLPDTNVTIQTLHNTRVAVAQQGVGANNVSQLAALHTALYTLQQQQIIQLQVIQQLQNQLVGSANIASITRAATAHPVGPLTGTAALTPPQSADGSGAGVLALTTTTPSVHATESAASAQNLTSNNSSSSALSLTQSSTSVTESNSLVKPPPPPPPPPNEPNTLELLQRHTEQALQNTMAGSSFLLNGLSGLGSGSDILRFCKGKSSDLKRENSDEAYFRHRCRFCGKVFGSDSALQIHIRSHTGERPFKCNVCGNRFSTKGNLKVHFQRHKDKYPHIKMNPHPVPLHLDNLHPPLEPPEASQTPPILGTGSNSQSIAPSLPPPNLLPAQPIALVTHPTEKDRESPTESLTQQPPDGVQSTENGLQLAPRSISPNEGSNMSDESEGSVADGYASEDNAAKDGDASRFDEEAMDHDDDSFSSSPKPDIKEADDKVDREPKPLTTENGVMMTMSIVPSIPAHINTSAPTFPSFYHPSLSPSFSMAPMCFPPMSTNTLTITSSSRPPLNPNNSDCGDHMGLSPDPTAYQDLLPKPGSNDNSWESLMEVTKTSETSKLQQLVDNIEHKLSDPNQCVICHRVLSCKSALQMHYRTHTGERPFKCKICSRAFTTKGNLKTHMGVHRVKPPLRVLHQCPVCHKQFTNSLVLQQHIRMHTGEPTDMHPEQIMANEIRPSPLLATTFPRPLHPALISHYSSPPMLPPHPSPPVLSSSACSTPQTSEAPPSSVSSIAPPVETVIKTASKAKEIETADEVVTSIPTPTPASRPSSVKTENSPTPQPTTVPEKTPSPVTTSTVTSTNRSVSPSMDKPIVTTAPYSPSYTASLVALENHVKAINTTIPQTLPFSPFGMGLAMGGFLRYDDSAFTSRNQAKDMSVNRDKSPAPFPSYSPSPNTSRAGSDGSADERSTPGSMMKAESPISVNGGLSNSSSGVITSKSESGALDLTPKTSVVPMSPSVTDMKLFPSPLAGLPFPSTPGRLSTTCRICFKTFACNSALEIHYRSHTKERPFKCNVCDRGFSTKGNMKQHMLTHKIRDLPPQLFTTASVASTTNTESNSSTNASNRTSSPLSAAGETIVNIENKESPVVKVPATPPSPIVPLSTIISPMITSTPIAVVTDSILSRNGKTTESEGITKRPINDSSEGSSLPKRSPGFPKHFCTICQKPFSSASALQIHNRTHTGDKPFKCSICGRAFTTKGNLKVHMGTHMWNNGTSRRGRRMSLELPPLQLPPHGKHDFPHHVRPELYFPYMPPGYMNGMIGPPKMNEISVIQSATGITNGNVSTPSSMTLTPAVSMMTPTMSLGQQQPPFVRKVTQASTDSGVDDVDATSPDEAENLKVHHSPTRPVEINSPPSPRTISSPNNNNNNNNTERGATWGWKIACNVCNKICSSSTDLEVHLKTHCNSSVKDSVRSAQQTTENIAS